MNNSSLVSCIIIFFNAERFIHEAIESVFAQTYNEWELLLVDDGSCDKSTDIALNYVKKYPEKVRYLTHEGHCNRGMSATRNLGISSAKGEYIAFLDADDVWLPQKLKRQMAILKHNTQVDIVFGPTQYWHTWRSNSKDGCGDSLREIYVQSDTLFHPPILLELLLRDEANAPATCSVLMRRKVIDQVGGFEEEFKGMFEDQVFFAKVYLKFPVYIMREYLDRYRQHPDSTCHIAQKMGQYDPIEKNPSHLNFLNWIEGYLTTQQVKNPEIWKALKIAFLPYHHPFLHYIYKIKRHLFSNG